MIKELIKEYQYHKCDFRSKVESIYSDTKNQSIYKKKKELIAFYSETDATEEKLFWRYRELQYKVGQSFPLALSMCISVFTAVFVTSAIDYMEMFILLKAILLLIVSGLLTYASCKIVIQGIKLIYMKEADLLLYPIEIELLEQRLLQDTDTEKPTVIGSSRDDSNAKK